MKNQIKSLTGLRFVFVVCLFLHHMYDAFTNCNIEGYWNVMKYLDEGYCSVDFFFILSGFVISYSYLSKVEVNQISSASFLANRLFKLWPVHVLTYIIAMYVYSGKDYFGANMLSARSLVGILMLQSYVPDLTWAFWGNGPAWSISVELFFYIAFLFLARLKHTERKALFATLLGVVLMNSILVGNDLACAKWFYYINPVFRLLDFLAGMLLYEWCQKATWRPATVKAASVLELASISILLGCAFLAGREISQEDHRFETYYYLLPCLLVIYTYSFDMGIGSKLLGTKLFQILGRCSFTFYISHQFVLYVVKQTWRNYIVDIPSMFLYAGIAFVISLILSVLLHYVVEEPANRFLRRWWKAVEAKRH